MPPVQRRSIGLWAFCAFFAFGTVASAGTSLALLFPESPFRLLWRLKPQAQLDFEVMGNWALAVMLPVALACGFTTVGLWLRRSWARRLAIGVLAVNLLGDAANAMLRSDPRTLMGIPIGGAMIAYLLTPFAKSMFRRDQICLSRSVK